jgi:hypothetical protein
MLGRRVITAALLVALLAPGDWCCVVAAWWPANPLLPECCREKAAAAAATPAKCPHCASGESKSSPAVAKTKASSPREMRCCRAATPAVVRAEVRLQSPLDVAALTTITATDCSASEFSFASADAAALGPPPLDFEAWLCRRHC